MDSIIEIIISGNTSGGTKGGTLDLYQNEPINLNLSISSIQDITKTQASFSQTFVLPSTINNDSLFSEIFYISSDSAFDPRKKAKAYILVDGIQIMSGSLQLLSIGVDDMDKFTYEVMIFGETNDLFSKIDGLYLEDINWSGLNHTLSISAITNSWTGTSANGYYYPLIDYGYGWSQVSLYSYNGATPLRANQFFPATYNKTIVDKIFAEAGMTYSSSFLNSSIFTNTIVPFNGDPSKILPTTFVTSRQFQVQQNSVFSPVFTAYTGPYIGQNMVYYESPSFAFPNALKTGQPSVVPNGGQPTIPNFDNGNLYVSGGVGVDSYYSSNTISVQRFTGNIVIQMPSTALPYYTPQAHTVVARWYRGVNGNQLFYTEEKEIPPTLPGFDSPVIYQFQTPILNQIANQFSPVTAGEKVQLRVSLRFYTALPYSQVAVAPIIMLGSYTYWYNEVLPEWAEGVPIDYNNVIPKKVKQTDYLKSIINMFNLFVEPSKDNPNKLLIEPRSTYYSTGATKDWTTKLDLSKQVVQKLLSEQQQKKYKFSYTDDKDYFNSHYKDALNKTYGELIYDFENDFTTDEKDITVIFSPTPVTNVIQTTNIIIPVISTIDSLGNYQKTESNIRFLVKKPNPIPINQPQYLNFAGDPNGPQVNWYNKVYPYAGHLDDPFTGTTDYNFGKVDWVYYNLTGITNNNLVNVYWKTFLDGIADKDSRQVTAYFYLTPNDINQFNFSDSIFVDGLTSDGGHYFTVDSIDYTPTDNGSSKVVLLKIPNKQFTPSNIALPPQNPAGGYNMVLNIGDGQILNTFGVNIGNNNIIGGTGSVSIGGANVVQAGSDSSTAIGNFNTLGSNTPSSFIAGNNNTIADQSNNTVSFGSNNTFQSGSSNNFVIGSNNLITTGVTGTTLLNVNGYTAFSSNTSVVTNLEVVNNINIQGAPLQALWLSGTTGSVYLANGTGNVASGTYSYSEGNATTASGLASHAEGNGTTAIGNFSHAEGSGSIANNDFSHVEGSGSQTLGDYAHAEGNTTTAAGQASHSEGGATLASGITSHAEGSSTIASGIASHAEGANTTASGDYSHAEGNNTVASAQYSHAEGQQTTASGLFSHAEGNGAKASHLNEWARAYPATITFNAQYGIVNFVGETTSNVLNQELFLDGGTDRFTIQSGNTYAVEVTAIATNETTQDSKMWTGTALVKNVAGTVSFVGTPSFTSLYNDVSMSGVLFQMLTDNTNKTIYAAASGLAATNIAWNVAMKYTALLQ